MSLAMLEQRNGRLLVILLKLTLEGEHHCQNNFVLLDSNFLTTLHMYLCEL